jgi:beta-glucosidase
VKPGETRTVEIPVAASRLAYWDAKTKALTVESEPIALLAGDSSASLPLSVNVRVN